MKVKVNQDKCIGCNLCFTMSEGNIGTDFGEDGKADVNPKADLADDKVQEGVLLAAETCPTQAIEVEKD